MMAERRHDAELLNRAARAHLRADGALVGPALSVAGREFQVGDEVVTLTQAGHTLTPAGRRAAAYIRTGTVGVVTAVHLDADRPEHQALTVRFPGRGDVRVDWTYLTHAFPDGRDGGLAHAYALTAHKAEGSTMRTARAVVPEDTSKAGLYVMLSRARRDLRAYLIRRDDLRDGADPADDEEWLPILREPTGPLQRVVDHLRQSRTERLATEYDPTAREAHRLRQAHTLAELTRLRRDAAAGRAGAVDLLTIRRAELATEAATATAAVTNPPAGLVAHLGDRPAAGPDRAIWDQAVSALSVYRARHQPTAPADQLGPPPTADADEPEHRWRRTRAVAEQIATAWTTGLSPGQARRFTARAEQIPRQRAITGIHALLANGWDPDTLTAKLALREQVTVRTGAAVLDHRVGAILDAHGIDPGAYQLPPPRSPREEWHHAAQLLRAAEVNHLAARPTDELASQHRALSRLLAHAPNASTPDHLIAPLADRARHAEEHTTRTARRLAAAQAELSAIRLQPRPNRRATDHARRAADAGRRSHTAAHHQLATARGVLAATQPGADPGPLRDRLGLIDAALARQLDHAATQLAREPAPYLTALLGSPPDLPALNASWRRAALAVEHYRHHTLGLPYGPPAAGPDAPATEQALGTPPDDIADLRRYRHLCAHQPTLDLGAAI
jgi:hypothetical protein